MPGYALQIFHKHQDNHTGIHFSIIHDYLCKDACLEQYTKTMYTILHTVLDIARKTKYATFLFAVLYFCICSPPGMFLPLNLLLEFWTEHATTGHIYVTFVFSMRIFFRRFLGLQLIVQCLLSWNNHLCPACRFTFWKFISKQHRSVNLT